MDVNTHLGAQHYNTRTRTEPRPPPPHTQALNDRTGELLAVKLVAEDEGAEGGARGEALRLCLATRHPNLVRHPSPRSPVTRTEPGAAETDSEMPEVRRAVERRLCPLSEHCGHNIKRDILVMR